MTKRPLTRIADAIRLLAHKSDISDLCYLIVPIIG
jgi:hypothetical protein